MASYRASDTMPKLGHVTDLREQWLVKTDGALAHHLQDREISSHLCENRYRNQQIREDFPVALTEQQGIEHEAFQRDLIKRRQAEIDAEIAREMAEINLRHQRRNRPINNVERAHNSREDPSTSYHSPPPAEPPRERRVRPPADPLDDVDVEALGLSRIEIIEMRRRLEQEEKDARLARELSSEGGDADMLLADMRCAVEAQDGELARLLQDREYKKLQKAKEKARQKALMKKQQRLAAQPTEPLPPLENNNETTLLDAYSNPRDLIRDQRNGHWASKSVDSDLNYVEPFEKEHIQSKASALQSKELSQQWYAQNMDKRPDTSGSSQNLDVQISNSNSRVYSYSSQPVGAHSFDSTDNDIRNMPTSQSLASMQHRQPPPVPITTKKPRFPDPVSIRPASHYPTDNSVEHDNSPPHPHYTYSDNNNTYGSTFPPDYGSSESQHRAMIAYTHTEASKRLSIVSDTTPESSSRRKNKKCADVNKKKKGCKIQ